MNTHITINVPSWIGILLIIIATLDTILIGQRFYELYLQRKLEKQMEIQNELVARHTNQDGITRIEILILIAIVALCFLAGWTGLIAYHNIFVK